MSRKSLMPRSSAPTLMLTSLLDMFTIILIFLIVSFESEDQGFQLSDQVKLPESSARGELKQAVNVVITGESVLLGEKVVARLSTRRNVGDLGQDEIPDLVTALEAEHERRFGDAPEGDEIDAVIVVQSDRKTDYRTLYAVLRSAATAGFFKYRLAVLKS